MNRRQAIKQSLLLLGGAVYVSSSGLLYQSCSPNQADKNELDLSLMDEICDTLIPETTIPGAKAVGVGAFVIMMLEDCYPDETTALVREGLQSIQQKAKEKTNSSFEKLSYEQRQEVLKDIEKGGAEYFKIIKGLTNKGYYTSEVGCTQALAFDFIPGGYNPCLTIDEKQRAWAM